MWSSLNMRLSPSYFFALIVTLTMLSPLSWCHPTSEFPETVPQDHLEKPQSDHPSSGYDAYNSRSSGSSGKSSIDPLPVRIPEHGPLELVDNGYEGVLVAISDDVPQEHCNHIIHGLKGVLRELSHQMWVATSGRASLRHVTVALPRTWRTDALSCSLLQPVTAAAPPVHAHITVSEPHPVFGNRPWAQQSQGCGRPGDKIRLGGDILRGGSNESQAHTARLLLSEWAKFRWGVFEEKGVPGDPLYPPQYRDPNTHRWEATACTDGPIHATGPECDPLRAPCSVSPDPYANTHLTSSLLALPDLPTVRQFCEDQNHNRVAPTKHNALCGGRSAWEIIQQSVDFIQGRNLPSNATRGLDPVIKYVREEGPRYVLVIEDTASMNLQRRWEYLRKAIRRVVVYDVPDRSHVAIVTFNSIADRVAPLNFIESEYSDKRQKVGSALPRNPSSVPESQKCILCGLQEALRTIDEASQDSVGANIILVSSGAGVATLNQMDEMLHLIESRRIRVTPVIYPMTERSGSTRSAIAHGLEPLAGSGGRSFTVMDEGVGNDSKVSMLVALMDALMAAVRLSGQPDSPGSPVLVHKSAYPGGIASMSTGSFALDDSLGPNARFSVYYYDLNHVGNSIQLTKPSGQTLAAAQEEDGDVNMIFVSLENAERGLWSYTVENRADSHQGLYVQVTAKRNTSSGLRVKLWTSSTEQAINASEASNPVIMFASVTFGEAPVLNAKVVAKLQRLGVNATGSSYEPIYIDLNDNGIGDPDITANDGIYSRYLPQLHHYAGRYLLSADFDYNNGMALVAKSSTNRHHKLTGGHINYYHQSSTPLVTPSSTPCCGSALRHQHTRRAPPFHRHLAWGVLDLVEPAPVHDNTPPNRILDLRVSVNDSIHEVSLKWTAPGDNWDQGRVSYYEALVAPSWRQARAFQGNKLKGLPTPLPAGTLHTTTLFFTRFEQLWYVTIRAVDGSGNIGGIGNIATLWVPRPPTTYEITTRTQPGLTTSRETYGNYTVSSELGASRQLGFGSLQVEDIAIILGSVGGLLIISALLITYCYCYTARRKKQDKKHHQQQQKDSVEKSRNGSIIVKSNSCSGVEEDGRRGSVDSGIKEVEVRPLSPVQSWGATRLLQEHERRLSIHSSADAIDDQMVAMQPGVPSPFPDVTVTDYPHQIPTPTPSSTNTTNTYSTDPPPSYTQYLADSGVQQCCVGPEYQGYNGAWDEPLTGHLLGRNQNSQTVPEHVVGGGVVAMPPPPQGMGQGHMTQGQISSASIPQGPMSQQGMMTQSGTSDRKRRNVTQV